MAVVIPPSLKRNFDTWRRGSLAPYPVGSPEQHMGIMSYNYPPPPPPRSGAEIDVSISGVRPYFPQPPQPSQLPPQLPPPPQLATTPEQAADKKRNKLGYHRTSVACGHCRRRKIRCIPSPADVQGRCINCIRLKKECSFYPVDQQPATEPGRKSSARSSNMAPPMKPSGTDRFSPDNKMPSSASGARPYHYNNHAGMTNWMADASPNTSKPGDWRTYPSESPVTPAFSPYTAHAPQQSATWTAPFASEPSSRDEMWSSYPSAPPRSLSFSAETMGSHQQYPSISPMSGRSYDRKSASASSDTYPATMATTVPGIETIPGTRLEHSVSPSAGAVAPAAYASWPQSYPYSKAGEGYAGWYGDAAPQQPDPIQQSSGDHAQPGGSTYYSQQR